ncbi:MAG: metal ABC transporter permease [Actinobacteria bacterium]|nr:metal ABC transporter permease [Actinomycetota bacterium]
MDWFLDAFRTDDARRALVAALLVVGTTSLVGTWVVIRGLSFIGDAFAHGVLPGITVAFLIGIDPTLGAAAGALVMVGGIHLVTRRTNLAEETGVGLLFVGLLALGVVIASRAGMEAEELGEILFGDVFEIGAGDLILAVAVLVGTAIAVAVFYRPFLVMAFNEQKAEVLGLHPRVAHLALLVLVAAAVVSSFRAVGTLLVFGLLVGPPATAALVVRRVPAMMATAVALGSASAVAGLVISHHARTDGGATIAATAVAVFFVVLVVRESVLPFFPAYGRRERAEASAG